ncbi:glutamate receptor ionotropic, delta-2-like [Palaemon carinicauda]|uniref:glutamate receptor ionotropic, delta-2-like n=1 Tax=Palaemon carinicauda TaxID=392227 RepID=UPI0035B5D711
MDYTHAIIDDQMATIGSTGSTEIDVWAFVMPLTFKVWLSIFASLFLLIVIMRLLVWTTGNNMKDKTFVFVCILLVQGARDLKRYMWQRMIVGAWIVGTTVLVFSYSGNLMSLLAVRYLPQPYQTLKDVLDDPDVTMVWEINTAYVHAFRKATSGDLLRVKETDDRNEIVYVFSTEYHNTLNTLVINGRYVLTLEAISIKMLMAEQFTATGKCQYYISKGKFMPNVYAVGVQKKSSLLQPLNKRITAVTQSGIYHYWLNQELQNATTCLTAPQKIIVHSALSMKNIWGIFMILVVGHGVSIGILLLERMLQNSMKKSSRLATPFEDI